MTLEQDIRQGELDRRLFNTVYFLRERKRTEEHTSLVRECTAIRRDYLQKYTELVEKYEGIAKRNG